MSRVDLAYPVAIGLAEGGWVTVLYLLVDAIARVHAPLGLPVLAAVGAGTCLLADRLDRLSSSRLAVIVGLLVGGAVAGLALTTGGLVSAGAVDPVSILTADPGAMLVGLAALRGFVRGGAIRDPGEAARPLFVGLIGLSFAWAFGGALSEPMRSVFRDDAVVPTLAFVIGGLAATGLARSTLAAADTGLDPRANRAWLAILLGSAAALGLAALPAAVGLERLMAALIAWPLTLPLLFVTGFIARIVVPSRRGILRRAGSLTLGPLAFLAGLALLAALLPQRGSGPQADQPAGAGGPTSEPTTPLFDALLGLLAIALVVAVLLFLARAWRRNVGATDRPGGTEWRDRVVDTTGTDLPGRRGIGARLWWARHRRPADAVAAYLAALRALEPDERLRRDPDETPAAHASRLRRTGAGTLELDLLAADFELARWGGRRLSPAEDRRAVSRWERLRNAVANRRGEG
jgi:Domain of unknown function (DUF4129)